MSDALLNVLLAELAATPYSDRGTRDALIEAMERTAIAAAARQGGDVQQAPGEAPQSGGGVTAASPKPSR
jgi:hypothetical protein